MVLDVSCSSFPSIFRGLKTEIMYVNFIPQDTKCPCLILIMLNDGTLQARFKYQICTTKILVLVDNSGI